MNDEKVRNDEHAKQAAQIEDLPVADANADDVKGGLVVDNGSGMSHH